MNWLLEQPMAILAVGAVLLVVMFFVMQQSGDRRAVIGMIAVALLTAVMLVVERVVETPQEQVRAVLTQIAHDAESNDVDAVCAHISRRDPDLAGRARTMLKPIKLERVEIKRVFKLDVKPDGNPPHAMAHIRVLAVGGDKLGTFSNQRALREFEVRFVREDDQWKVRSYEELDLSDNL